jgi:hypothetical protein
MGSVVILYEGTGNSSAGILEAWTESHCRLNEALRETNSAQSGSFFIFKRFIGEFSGEFWIFLTLHYWLAWLLVDRRSATALTLDLD